jgi:hypothetical protein
VPSRAVSRLAVLALSLSACAGTGEPLGEDSQAITSGSPASDPAVVALVDRRTSSNGPPPSVQCSGSVVDEWVVLTAAHCVERRARGMLEVFFGTSPGAPHGEYRGIARHRVHSRYDRQFDDNDLALVWLEAPAPVVPVPLTLDAPSTGRPARLVGFGRAASEGDGGAPEKLTGDVQLSEVTDHTVRYGPAPGMSCNGDSGGPLFIDTGDGEKLAGVISSGDPACRRFGVAARTDVQRTWFIDPALDSQPTETARIGVGELCGALCADDGDCPHDLVCRSDLGGPQRCVLPSLPAGAFESSCRSDAECPSGACVPLGEGARCFRPCDDDTDAATPERGGGCSLRAPARPPACSRSAVFALLVSLSVALRARRVWPRRHCRRERGPVRATTAVE